MVVVVAWEAHDVTLGNENMRGGRVRSRRYINYKPLLSSFLGGFVHIYSGHKL